MDELFNLNVPKKEFIIINYPMIINNEESAFKTLGSLNIVKDIIKNNLCGKEKKNIKLNFRPEMIYSNAIISDLVETKDLIMKVKEVRNKKTGETKIVPEVLGSVKQAYEFNTICDYQFSPHDSDNKNDTPSNMKVFYDKLLPITPFKSPDDFTSFIKSNDIHFLPPLVFSKGEKPTDSRLYRNQTKLLTESFINTETSNKADFDHSDLVILKDLFETQPMWITNCLRETLMEKQITSVYHVLKYRTVVADNILNGIWRRTWVKKNYDYKGNPESRIYQVIDFRGNPCHINFLKKYIRHSEKNNNSATKIYESGWRISPQYLPTSKNCYYQLHNIDIPEIVELLKEEPFPEECHEQWGWFTCDIYVKCRNILLDFVANKVDNLMNETMEPMEIDN